MMTRRRAKMAAEPRHPDHVIHHEASERDAVTDEQRRLAEAALHLETLSAAEQPDANNTAAEQSWEDEGGAL